MNSISHFFLDRHHPSDYFKFGTVLPDLLRISSSKLRLNSISVNPPVENPLAENVRRGIIRHINTDKHFHNSDFFHKHSSRLKLEFLSNNLNRPGIRLSFISHILIEMILDRLLLIMEPEIGKEFYSDLSKVNEDVLHFLFQGNPNYSHPDFCFHFKRFQESRYLLSYIENKNLFYAVNRVCKNIGTPSFEGADYKIFELAIGETEHKMKSDFINFFETLR